MNNAAAPTAAKQNFMISQLDEVPPVRCPCGGASRSFATPDNHAATAHVVDSQLYARAPHQ